jgi:serine phosphatase RsbU (regulator of sigma subunit)
MAVKYDTEKTETENKIQRLTLDKQDADLKQQRLYIIFGISGALLMACLVFLFWRSYHITKKSNRKIEAQKAQIELQRDEIQEKNHEITSSIEYAKFLQSAILPYDFTIKQYLPESFVLWLPRDIVSGDFYWFYEKDDIIYYAVADCTGHGVPGAFVSMTCHNILNQVVIDKGFSEPGLVLSKVNDQVCKVFKYDEEGMKAQDGMDVVFCKIDRKKKEIEFAGALNPVLIIRDQEVIEYKTDKFPIGGRTPEGFMFKTQQINLKENDWVYLFSDGFKDQFGGEKGKKMRSKNFVNLLVSCSKMRPEEQHNYLLESLLKWQGNYERVDDILVSGFKV